MTKLCLQCFQWDYGLSERTGDSVDGVIKCRGRREIDDVTVTGGNGESDFLSLNELYYLFLASGSGGSEGECVYAWYVYYLKFLT